MSIDYIAAAKRYADADKSDPFTFARCQTHIHQGLCGYLTDGSNGSYDATAYQEERLLPDGRAYTVTVYRNIVRP